MRTKEVHDFNYSALLIYRGYKLLGVQWESRKAFWQFEDKDGKADDLIRSYINGEIKGDLKKFVQAQGIIKQTLFSKN